MSMWAFAREDHTESTSWQWPPLSASLDPHRCFVMTLYCCDFVRLYCCCILLPSYCCVVMLLCCPCCCVVVSLHCCVVVLLCRCIVVSLYPPRWWGTCEVAGSNVYGMSTECALDPSLMCGNIQCAIYNCVWTGIAKGLKNVWHSRAHPCCSIRGISRVWHRIGNVHDVCVFTVQSAPGKLTFAILGM